MATYEAGESTYVSFTLNESPDAWQITVRGPADDEDGTVYTDDDAETATSEDEEAGTYEFGIYLRLVTPGTYRFLFEARVASGTITKWATEEHSIEAQHGKVTRSLT